MLGLHTICFTYKIQLNMLLIFTSFKFVVYLFCSDVVRLVALVFRVTPSGQSKSRHRSWLHELSTR